VLIDFIYENDLVTLGRKSLVKKKADSHLGDGYPFEKKRLNAHGRENRFGKRRGADSHLGDDIRLREKIKRAWT